MNIHLCKQNKKIIYSLILFYIFYFLHLSINKNSSKLFFMKKMLLAALALTGTGVAAEANMLTVNNLTPCTYTISLSGGSGTVIPPGTSTFYSFGTVNITAIKIMWGGGVTQVNVGYGSPYHNSIGQPTPTCLAPGGFYTASWAQASPSADASMVIF